MMEKLTKAAIIESLHGKLGINRTDIHSVIDELFEESLEYFEECGFRIDYITRDLHNSDFSKIYGENFMTEHERMFSQEGIKIKYCTAVKDVLPEKKDGEKEVSE